MTEEIEIYQNKKRIMASYGSREMFGQFITAAFGFNVLFFYETVIGLQAIYIMIAFVIYSLWNAFNDPLIGYIMEKIKYRMPWEKKWGYRRVPWMLIGAIPWLFSYLLIYMVPITLFGTSEALEANQWNKTKTAKALGISYRSLMYKINEYNLRSLQKSRSPLPFSKGEGVQL